MNNSLAGTNTKFTNLLEAVAADGNRNSAAASGIAVLGPSVEANGAQHTVTALGPSVGDDGAPSDVRLKHDVCCVGATVFGLPLYRFEYIGEPEIFEGVMAHEVLEVMPSAVSVSADGYYRVDYDALGTSMRRVS